MFPFRKAGPRPAVAISEIERDIHTEREFLGRICRLKATYRSLKEEEVPEVEVGRYPRPIHSWHRKQSGSLVGTGSLLGLFLARSRGQSSATTDDELIHVATDTKRKRPAVRTCWRFLGCLERGA